MLTPVNHRQITDQVAADLLKTIEQNPSSFEAMVYKAQLNDTEDNANTPDPVGTLEARDKALSFAEPVLTRGLMLPADMTGATMLASGLGALDDNLDSPLVALLKEPGIPEQSVVWFEEVAPDDTIKVTLLYVLKSEPIGHNGAAGSKHILLPFSQGQEPLQAAGDADQASLPQLKNSLPDQPATTDLNSDIIEIM